MGAIATRAAAPHAGAVYVCDTNGTLLAGSNWVPQASPDIATQAVAYATLWEVPAPWAKTITRSMVMSSQRSEQWHGRDLVIVQPLFSSGVIPSMSGIGGPNGTLRAVVYCPRD